MPTYSTLLYLILRYIPQPELPTLGSLYSLSTYNYLYLPYHSHYLSFTLGTYHDHHHHRHLKVGQVGIHITPYPALPKNEHLRYFGRYLTYLGTYLTHLTYLPYLPTYLTYLREVSIDKVGVHDLHTATNRPNDQRPNDQNTGY